ncbi:MAG: FemAB family XrtA/PEP-CTERM system-associated protein [Planctomycetota bacterium]
MEERGVRVRVVEQVEGGLADEVRAFVSSQPVERGACMEQDPRWLEVLRDGLGHRPRLLVVEQDGAVVGVLPLAGVRSVLFGRFLVSLPYLNRAGIVAADDAVAVVLWEAAKQEAQRVDAKYLELRHHAWRLGAMAQSGLGISQTKAEKSRMVLGLPGDADSLWSGFSAKVRNQVRKGDKHGLNIAFGGRELLDGFYSVFAVNMRDLGTPVYPRRLFAAMLEHLGDACEIAVVTQEGVAIAGAVLVHDGWTGQGVSQVPSASCLRQMNHTNANMWMYHRLLCRAIERGSGSFDFGRSSEGSGTWRFKKQWGAEPEPTAWEVHLRKGEADAVRPDNPKYRRRIEAWQKLPVWVTRLAGPVVVRGIP